MLISTRIKTASSAGSEESMLKLIIVGWLFGIGFSIAVLSIILWILLILDQSTPIVLKGVQL